MIANIEDLEQGAVVKYAGVTWNVLEPTGTGIQILSESVWANKPFNEDTDQNWKNASIKAYMEDELLKELSDGGADEGDLSEIELDLTAVDGDTAYGKDTCRITLITEEQYVRLKEYISSVGESYWLVTPYSCNEYYIGGAYSHNVRIVRPDGSLDGSTADGGLYGVRPVICLKRGTEVEVVKSMVYSNVAELKDIVGITSPVAFGSGAVTLINKTAEICNAMAYVTDTLSQARTYAQSMTAEQVYFDILAKIVDGDAITHMDFAVFGLIPILKEKIEAQ